MTSVSNYSPITSKSLSLSRSCCSAKLQNGLQTALWVVSPSYLLTNEVESLVIICFCQSHPLGCSIRDTWNIVTLSLPHPWSLAHYLAQSSYSRNQWKYKWITNKYSYSTSTKQNSVNVRPNVFLSWTPNTAEWCQYPIRPVWENPRLPLGLVLFIQSFTTIYLLIS